MKTTSLETSRRLAGKVNIETEYWWVKRGDWEVVAKDELEGVVTSFDDTSQWAWLEEAISRGDAIPAYTTDELMEWLPSLLEYGLQYRLTIIKGEDSYAVLYNATGIDDDLFSPIYNVSLPEALALLAEYLVDNGIYKGKE